MEVGEVDEGEVVGNVGDVDGAGLGRSVEDAVVVEKNGEVIEFEGDVGGDCGVDGPGRVVSGGSAKGEPVGVDGRLVGRADLRIDVCETACGIAEGDGLSGLEDDGVAAAGVDDMDVS